MPEFDDSRFKVSAFFRMTPDLVCIAGKDGFFRKVNRAVINKLGYTEAELTTLPIESLIHPEDKELTRNERAELLNGKVLSNFQNRYITKSGQVVWLEWTSIYFPDEEIVFAIAKDISAKKHLEKEVEEKYKKFKSLATHFKSSIESDRKYLANELHEELAQLVSVLKIDIDWITDNLADLSDPVKNKIEHASVISDLLVKTIRRISFSISPGMLEDIGLNATLEWHCREFAILNGIPCRFRSQYDEAGLSDEIKTDFFRICQESLTNVMYHAVASNVNISIGDVAGKIILTISDDGRGFDVSGQEQSPGLTRMRERAASINGQLTIQSEPGSGTRICVEVTK
jgi:PAS domain S-box-containing protein